MTIITRVGQTETNTKVARWHECEECERPAKYRLTFLLSGARRNPASSAYGRDDCSHCSDLDMYACGQHSRTNRDNPPSGYVWCAEITLKAHRSMGFYWQEAN